jgi:hypothetical protein
VAKKTLPQTLGALSASEFGKAAKRGRSVKDEIRHNLLARIADGKPLFTASLATKTP